MKAYQYIACNINVIISNENKNNVAASHVYVRHVSMAM